MIVLSTNISIPQSIIHNGKEEKTGYFKRETDTGIYLDKTEVKNDFVADLVHHGGPDKACYLYGYQHYAYWQESYPTLEWEKGMFGENLTIESLDESSICIGDTFQIGAAVIQVSQPRQPCYKMGIRFQDPELPNKFRLAPFPGIYARVIQPGLVSKNDKMSLIEASKIQLDVSTVFSLLYTKEPDDELLELALSHPDLAFRAKEYLQQKFKK